MMPGTSVSSFERVLLFGVLCMCSVLAVDVEHVMMADTDFCEKDARSPGQYSFMWDKDDMFDVDLAKKETVYHAPDIQKFAHYQAEGGLQNMAVCYHNLDNWMKRPNPPVGSAVQPKFVVVYPEEPAIPEVPNKLVCSVDGFFPSVLNITWYKNGNPVYEGVEITEFYPRDDAYFRRFAFLNFLPKEGDTYTCKVEHPGLQSPIEKQWEGEIPSPETETTETVVCALGLAVGVLGILIGTLLVIKGMRQSEYQRRQTR
ncbi:H-2 class II histocompatibility antigen, A-Q alpha chain-like [Protopterus annectens]|uniref:H-2 class II histocompatibility antigen, A-Q alpha chain-like n=1 Tax=Protopterus annectens TaxID=7888 RepID=UPI001CFA2B19|nr:H-2 class II histocompatibility antigen, A-Q alpha chain-like [Protopterus annectens]